MIKLITCYGNEDIVSLRPKKGFAREIKLRSFTGDGLRVVDQGGFGL